VERSPRSFPPAQGIVVIADLTPVISAEGAGHSRSVAAESEGRALISNPLLSVARHLPAKRLVSAASASMLAQYQ
jgi:hypothetical protein